MAAEPQPLPPGGELAQPRAQRAEGMHAELASLGQPPRHDAGDAWPRGCLGTRCGEPPAARQAVLVGHSASHGVPRGRLEALLALVAISGLERPMVGMGIDHKRTAATLRSEPILLQQILPVLLSLIQVIGTECTVVRYCYCGL
eukprot:COSAG01_NODE_11468_length_1928_cov_1.982504_2_plen_144_part_00